MNPNTLSIVDCYQWANDWIRKKAVELASNDGITPDEYWSSTNQYQQPSTKSNILPYVKKQKDYLKKEFIMLFIVYSRKEQMLDLYNKYLLLKIKRLDLYMGIPCL